MNYLPLSSHENQQNSKQIVHKHRNPLYPSLKYPPPTSVHTLQSQITSSLFFQQLIYFNWFYSVIQVYLYTGSQIHRFMYFELQYGVPVRSIIGVIFVILQIFRLQNAFFGNIKQSFPEIFAFMLLTVLTASAQLILISGLVPCSPLEWSLLFYGIIFHLFLFTMSKLTESQKALFLWRSPTSQKK